MGNLRSSLKPFLQRANQSGIFDWFRNLSEKRLGNSELLVADFADQKVFERVCQASERLAVRPNG